MRFDAVFKGCLTVLGIAAIALVAAILDSPVDFTNEGGGAPTGSRSGSVDPIVTPEIPLSFQVMSLIVVAFLAGLVVLHFIDEPMENLVTVVGIVLGVALILGIYTLFSIVGNGPGFPAGDANSTSPGVATSNDGQGGNVTAATYVVTSLGAFFVILLGTMVFLRSRSGSSNEVVSDEANLDTDAPAAAVGAAAGRAATEIESVSKENLENEIYRAWREMVTLLPVESPQTTTPREFETAAVEAGIEHSDVSDLTDLFEAVRYGTLETTRAREERAIDTLRRIESTYAADDESEVDS